MNPHTSHKLIPSVLVVDDDAFSRDVLQEMLAAQGILDVQTADNGRSALRVLEAMGTPPDLDGIEFMSELAQRQYRGDVVLVTGVDVETLSLAREIAAGQGLRLLGSFTKPLHREVLAQLLATR